MKLGVIARAEDRGLGNQTFEVCKALRPERVLVVEMGALAGGFTAHLDRYAGLGLNVTVVPVDRLGDPAAVGAWLSGLDVVYTAETFYAPDFPALARAAGVATVCHLNPEFYKHGHEPDWPRPSAWWVPSPWLIDDARLPSPRLVPMPVPQGMEPAPWPREPGPLRVLHVAGKPTAGDRNGTRGVLMALRLLRAEMHITVRAQAASMPHPGRVPRHVRYTAALGNVPDFRRIYSGHDVLVMPRRYGGLCLPVLEAAAAGLAVVMTDCSPNQAYPAALVRSACRDEMATPLGAVPAFDVHPPSLAAMLDALAGDRDLVEQLRFDAEAWAVEHSWEALAGTWRVALEDACHAEATRH